MVQEFKLYRKRKCIDLIVHQLEITTIDSLRQDTGKRSKHKDSCKYVWVQGTKHCQVINEIVSQGDKSLHGDFIGHVRRTKTEKEERIQTMFFLMDSDSFFFKYTYEFRKRKIELISSTFSFQTIRKMFKAFSCLFCNNVVTLLFK